MWSIVYNNITNNIIVNNTYYENIDYIKTMSLEDLEKKDRLLIVTTFTTWIYWQCETIAYAKIMATCICTETYKQY